MADYTIHFDGSCWPNPGGCAAYGSVVEQGEITICAEAGVLDTSPLMSNNVAEFHALNIAFTRLIEHGLDQGDSIAVRGDSNLVIQMMSGKYRPKADKLYYPFYQKTEELARATKILTGAYPAYKWIPREQNTRCDILSKEHNHAPK